MGKPLDILFVNPAGYRGTPRRGPYELDDLTHKLAKAGFSTELLDVQREVGERTIPYPINHIEAVYERIRSKPARMILITIRTTAGPWAHEVAKRIKARSPDTLILAHAPRIEERVLRLMKYDESFDALFLAGAGFDLVQAVKVFLSKGRSAFLREAGIVSQQQEDSPAKDKLGRSIAVHELGTPWISPDRTIAAIQVGRGCPDRCTFCAAHLGEGARPVYSDAEAIVKKAQAAFDLLDSDRRLFVLLETENLTSNESLVRQIADRREFTGSTFKWGAYGRIDHMDLRIRTLLEASGCRFIFFGIETPVPRLLKVLGKLYDTAVVLPRIRALQHAGIITQSSFIFGIPGETFDDFAESAKLMANIVWSGGHIDWSPLRIEAGSAMERMTEGLSTRAMTSSDLYRDLCEAGLDPNSCDPTLGYRLYGLDQEFLDIDHAGMMARELRNALIHFPLAIYALHVGLGISFQAILRTLAAQPSDMILELLNSHAEHELPQAASFISELRNFEEGLSTSPQQCASSQRYNYNFCSLYAAVRNNPELLPEVFCLNWWKRANLLNVEDAIS